MKKIAVKMEVRTKYPNIRMGASNRKARMMDNRAAVMFMRILIAVRGLMVAKLRRSPPHWSAFKSYTYGMPRACVFLPLAVGVLPFGRGPKHKGILYGTCILEVERPRWGLRP